MQCKSAYTSRARFFPAALLYGAVVAAIPAVIGYNHFLGRLRGMDLLIDEFIADFIHRIQGRRS